MDFFLQQTSTEQNLTATKAVIAIKAEEVKSKA